MSLAGNDSFCLNARVIPVLSPLSVASGVAISEVLFDAGLSVQEITLRTHSGLETIAALKRDRPDRIVGAGSVLTPELGEAALRAGADFLVSPGMTEDLLKFALTCGVPFLPGVATLSEIMRVAQLGCAVAKLFPAESLGGLAFLRSIAGPLPAMKFCPTGGIDQRLASAYLKLDNVLAVGGSWMVPNELILGGKLEAIHALAEQAAAL